MRILLIFLILYYECTELSEARSRRKSNQNNQNEMASEVEVDFSINQFSNPSVTVEDTLQTEFCDDYNATGTVSCSPSTLYFNDVRVCMPQSEYFTVSNFMSTEITIKSLSSSSFQFHPVFSSPKILSPEESITIEVVFFPFYVETTKGKLVIHSSRGDYEYFIVGRAVQNPHHLHPFTGMKLPLGVAYEQSLLMYNPYNDILYIREIYTTEDFLTLVGSAIGPPSAPSNSGSVTKQTSGSNKQTSDSTTVPTSTADLGMFQVGPGETVEVIKIMISAPASGEYNGYVHIRTDRGKSVIPVQVTILEAGLQAVNGIIDFQTLTSIDDIKTLPLTLMNNASFDVQVVEVIPVNYDPQLQVQLADSLVVRAGREATVAWLTHTATSQGKITNKVLVVSNHSNPALATLEVPYQATILHGGIGFEHVLVQFYLPIRNTTSVIEASNNKGKHIQNPSVVRRKLQFTNYFSIPVTLEGVSTSSCGGIFTIEGSPDVAIIEPLQKWPAVSVSFNMRKAMKELRDKLPYSCLLEVFTNVSSHRIPLQVLDGRLFLVAADAALFFCTTYEDMPGAPPREQWCANSDSYRLQLGKISAVRPRPIAAHFLNPNPVSVRVSVTNSSQPICLCLEALLKPPQPTAINAVLPPAEPPSDSTADPTNERNQLGNCICNPANLMVSRSVAYTDYFRGGAKKIEEPNLYLDIPSAHNFALSIQIDPQNSSARNINVQLGTQHQTMDLWLEFEAQEGSLNCNFGLNNDVSSVSLFGYSMSTKPLQPMVRLLQDSVRLQLRCSSTYSIEIPVTSLAVNGGLLPSENVRAHVVANTVKKEAGVIDIAVLEMSLLSFNLSNANNLLGLPPILTEGLVQQAQQANSAAYSRQPPVFKTRQLTSIGRLVFCHHRDRFDDVSHQLARIDNWIMSDKFRNAFEEMLRLKATLFELFPTHNYLPSFSVTVKSPVTFVTAAADSLKLQLPIDVLPDEHVIDLPVIRDGMVSLVYIEVYNPFDRPMNVRLRMITASDGGIEPDDHSHASAVADAVADAVHELARLKGDRSPTFTFIRSVPSFSANWSGTGAASAGDEAGPTSAPSKKKKQGSSSGKEGSSGRDKGDKQQDIHVIRGAHTHSSLRPRVQSTRQGLLADEGNPFVVRSASTDVWVALPFSTVLLGPVAYVPMPGTGTGDTEPSVSALGQKHSTTLYVANDMTGVDKVRLNGEWGTALLEARISKSSLVEDQRNLKGKEKASSGREDSSKGTTNSSAVFRFAGPAGTPIGSDSIPNLVIGHAVKPLSVVLSNQGSLSLAITDVLLDGISCSKLGNQHRASIKGCRQLPKTLHPGSNWTISTSFVADCALRWERRSISVESQPVISSSANRQPRSFRWGWLLIAVWPRSGTWTWNWPWEPSLASGGIDVLVMVDVVLSRDKVRTCIHEAEGVSAFWMERVEPVAIVFLFTVGVLSLLHIVVTFPASKRGSGPRAIPAPPVLTFMAPASAETSPTAAAAAAAAAVSAGDASLTVDKEKDKEKDKDGRRGKGHAKTSRYLRSGINLDDVCSVSVSEEELRERLAAVHHVYLRRLSETQESRGGAEEATVDVASIPAPAVLAPAPKSSAGVERKISTLDTASCSKLQSPVSASEKVLPEASTVPSAPASVVSTLSGIGSVTSAKGARKRSSSMVPAANGILPSSVNSGSKSKPESKKVVEPHPPSDTSTTDALTISAALEASAATTVFEDSQAVAAAVAASLIPVSNEIIHHTTSVSGDLVDGAILVDEGVGKDPYPASTRDPNIPTVALSDEAPSSTPTPTTSALTTDETALEPAVVVVVGPDTAPPVAVASSLAPAAVSTATTAGSAPSRTSRQDHKAKDVKAKVGKTSPSNASFAASPAKVAVSGPSVSTSSSTATATTLSTATASPTPSISTPLFKTPQESSESRPSVPAAAVASAGAALSPVQKLSSPQPGPRPSPYSSLSPFSLSPTLDPVLPSTTPTVPSRLLPAAAHTITPPQHTSQATFFTPDPSPPVQLFSSFPGAPQGLSRRGNSIETILQGFGTQDVGKPSEPSTEQQLPGVRLGTACSRVSGGLRSGSGSSSGSGPQAESRQSASGSGRYTVSLLDDTTRGRDQFLEDLAWAHHPLSTRSLQLGLDLDLSSPLTPAPGLQPNAAFDTNADSSQSLFSFPLYSNAAMSLPQETIQLPLSMSMNLPTNRDSRLHPPGPASSPAMHVPLEFDPWAMPMPMIMMPGIDSSGSRSASGSRSGSADLEVEAREFHRLQRLSLELARGRRSTPSMDGDGYNDTEDSTWTVQTRHLQLPSFDDSASGFFGDLSQIPAGSELAFDDDDEYLSLESSRNK